MCLNDGAGRSSRCCENAALRTVNLFVFFPSGLIIVLRRVNIPRATVMPNPFRAVRKSRIFMFCLAFDVKLDKVIVLLIIKREPEPLCLALGDGLFSCLSYDFEGIGFECMT